MIDELSASDEICRMFDAGWKAVDWASFPGGNAPQIMWEGRDSDKPPSLDNPYARVTITAVSASQASLAGETSAKQWLNTGLIAVQSFGPLTLPNSYEVAEKMAIIAKRVFQGNASPNGMWFRNCRTKRIGPSGGWYQFNTLIEYQFHELR